MRKIFSVFVSSILPELAVLTRLYPDVNGVCSATPTLIICLSLIYKKRQVGKKNQ